MNQITLEEIGKLAVNSWILNKNHLDMAEASEAEGWDNDPTGCSHLSGIAQKTYEAMQLLSDTIKIYHYQSGNFESDDEAVKFLEKQGFRVDQIIIGKINSKAEWAAVSYLCSEWDYGFEPIKE